MKSNFQERGSMTSNIKIVKSLTKKYIAKNLFSDNLTWVKEHFKNSDLFKDLNEIEKITKP